MVRTAAKEQASFLIFKDFPDAYSDFLSPLLKHGFHKIESYPAVELDIHFRSFDEYLTSLSKSTRKDIRRKFKDIDCRPAIKTEVRHELGPYLDEAYQLYLETFQKGTVRFGEIPREFFQNIPKHMPEQTRYFLWFIRGKLAAFDLCLVSGNCLIDAYFGMDDSLAYEFHLDYATFRDVMNWCIDHGIRKYRSSALTDGPKQRLDFKFRPLSIYAKHMNGFINTLLGLAKGAMDPYRSDPVLKTLKKNRVKKGKGISSLKIFRRIILNGVRETAFEENATAPPSWEGLFCPYRRTVTGLSFGRNIPADSQVSRK